MTTEPDPQMSGTAEGLIVFLDWAGRTGQLGSNTAAAYKTAVTQVLEIDGDLQKPLAAVRAPRMLEDSDAPFAQRPPPAVPGGNTRRSTGSSRSP